MASKSDWVALIRQEVPIGSEETLVKWRLKLVLRWLEARDWADLQPQGSKRLKGTKMLKSTNAFNIITWQPSSLFIIVIGNYLAKPSIISLSALFLFYFRFSYLQIVYIIISTESHCSPKRQIHLLICNEWSGCNFRCLDHFSFCSCAMKRSCDEPQDAHRPKGMR